MKYIKKTFYILLGLALVFGVWLLGHRLGFWSTKLSAKIELDNGKTILTNDWYVDLKDRIVIKDHDTIIQPGDWSNIQHLEKN